MKKNKRTFRRAEPECFMSGWPLLLCHLQPRCRSLYKTGSVTPWRHERIRGHRSDITRSSGFITCTMPRKTNAGVTKRRARLIFNDRLAALHRGALGTATLPRAAARAVVRCPLQSCLSFINQAEGLKWTQRCWALIFFIFHLPVTAVVTRLSRLLMKQLCRPPAPRSGENGKNPNNLITLQTLQSLDTCQAVNYTNEFIVSC